MAIRTDAIMDDEPLTRLSPGEYFGETVGRREVGGLFLVDSAYAPDTRIPPHAHEGAFYYLVLEGSLEETCGRTSRHEDRGAVVYHPAGETHSNHWLADGGRCFHLELSPDWLNRFDLPENAAGHEARPGCPVSWMTSRIHGEFQVRDSASALAIEGLTMALLAETLRGFGAPRLPEPHSPRWLAETRDWLEAHLSDPPSLHLLAGRAGVHPAHLARSFRRSYGESMGAYVRRRRIEEACLALAQTQSPLSEIALAAGFYDQSHFTRVFQRHTGFSPAAYRRQVTPRNSRTTG